MKDFEVLKYKLGLALAHHALRNVAYSQVTSIADLDVAEKEYEKALAINRDDLKAALGVARNRYQLGVIAQRRGRDRDDSYSGIDVMPQGADPPEGTGGW
jgi:hypothetical protein